VARMSTRLRWLLVGLVLLVIGVPLAILFLRTHERVTQLEHLPPQGEASYNPLYVLGQALRADGLTVQSQPRLDWPGCRCSRATRWCCCRTARKCPRLPPRR